MHGDVERWRRTRRRDIKERRASSISAGMCVDVCVRSLRSGGALVWLYRQRLPPYAFEFQFEGSGSRGTRVVGRDKRQAIGPGPELRLRLGCFGASLAGNPGRRRGIPNSVFGSESRCGARASAYVRAVSCVASTLVLQGFSVWRLLEGPGAGEGKEAFSSLHGAAGEPVRLPIG
ncbi:hypothetical protein GY45DRAFT_1035248 [Cubamyces sp. BRFM 1775]|nr:hypothetical protein GY45DRAFT_1035248 [Cubamyces sp. BRFM 1775]